MISSNLAVYRVALEVFFVDHFFQANFFSELHSAIAIVEVVGSKLGQQVSDKRNRSA